MSTMPSPRMSRFVSSSLSSPTSTKNLWPPKYNTQRDPIPEVSRACVEKLFAAIDADMDGYISREELLTFVKKSALSSFTSEMVKEVFDEVTEHRGMRSKEQLDQPLSFGEVYGCCKGCCECS
eukprot:TRINITY_DN6616_c0_g4_i2.p1 TRINITY_DN6616_c0_g4~~TRINITY_DN6616_c0_g4_i2.p1  ORF type:complete len:123 (-),score=12.52 TRINITY_DN6616_c0_g4_i2:1282-1650(-)